MIRGREKPRDRGLREEGDALRTEERIRAQLVPGRRSPTGASPGARVVQAGLQRCHRRRNVRGSGFFSRSTPRAAERPVRVL